MRGGSHDVSVAEWTGGNAASDEAGYVSHVSKEVRSGLVADLAHAGVVDVAGVGGCAGDDDLRVGRRYEEEEGEEEKEAEEDEEEEEEEEGEEEEK